MLLKTWTIRNYLEKLELMILVLAQISQLWKRNIIINARKYFNKFSLECCQKEGGSRDKKAKRIAFSDIATAINDNCTGKNNPMQLADWFIDRYKTVCTDEGGDEIKSQRFDVQNLAKKSRKQFGEFKLKIQADSTRKIIVWQGDLA